MTHTRRRGIPAALLALLTIGTAAAAAVAIDGHRGAPAGRTQAAGPTTIATYPLPPPPTTVVDPCGGVGPEPHSVASVADLEPLLLVASDLPSGYGTTGPGTTSLPEFLAALPASVPEVVVNFNHALAPAAQGNPSDGVSEALGLAPNDAQSAALVAHVLSVGQECNDLGPPIDLPGPISGLVVYDESGGGNSEEYINSAQLYASKGPYVVSITWFNSALTGVGSDAPTGAPPLPDPVAMAAVADAALDRLP
jgi:hypothetical protein